MKIILELTKNFLEKGAIIVFDELYNFPGWEVGEYKALKEIFDENDYKFLSFAKNGHFENGIEIVGTKFVKY